MAAPVVVTLLHFNIQYCAGGLEEIWADEGYDASDEALQDAIITESFAPVLDVLEAHPTWTFTLEMQGYMVEVMAERHPDVLEQLRTLAQAGQVELVSFHWSDTLFTAFPARDAEKSVELTQAALDARGLPLSEVVFTQEGQFSQGMLDRMPDWGYRVAVLPKNLAEYLWGGIDAEVYQYGEVLVVPGGAGNAYVDWSFFDDGELWATNDMNCYLGGLFEYDEESTQQKVAELEAAEADGARIAGIGAYVDSLEATPVDLPPVLDGTWQPDDTQNVFRWLGGAGDLWPDTEQDNAVRVANWKARSMVIAAESVPGVDEEMLEEAWRDLLLAEVSDSTGWNPYQTEVEYSLFYSDQAETMASKAIAVACGEAGHLFVEDAGSDAPTITPDGEPVETSGDWSDPPDGLVPIPAGRNATLAWTADEDGWRLDVQVEAGGSDFSLTFPWDGLAYTTVPALAEELVSIDAADVYTDDVALPLSWGVAALRDDWSVVLHHDSVFVAGSFSRERQVLTFADQTAPPEAFTWTFHLLGPGMGDPLEVARRINVEPDVVIDCGPVEKDYNPIPNDCECGSARGSPWWGLVGLFALRRRVRG